MFSVVVVLVIAADVMRGGGLAASETKNCGECEKKEVRKMTMMRKKRSIERR